MNPSIVENRLNRIEIRLNFLMQTIQMSVEIRWIRKSSMSFKLNIVNNFVLRLFLSHVFREQNVTRQFIYFKKKLQQMIHRLTDSV